MNLSKIVLSLSMPENDAGAKTVREYLVLLAEGVWREGEGFSGKRPFGNSGWHHEIYQVLIQAGVADGNEQAHKIICEAFEEMKA